MNKLTKKELKEQRKLEKQEHELTEMKQSKMKQFGIWGGLVAFLIITAGLIYLLSRPVPQEPVVSDIVNSSLPPVTAEDQSSGPESAKVTIIEYGDFQCPACGHYFPMVARLKNEFKDSVRFVYRHFPLTSIHQNAQIAAQATYAAAQQDKFWEMHDMLFQQQANWSESTDAETIINQFATKIGLDMNQFAIDMKSDAAQEYIKKQSEGGTKAGVSGTPTFYMNGKQITNPTTYEDFKKLVESELSSR